MRTITFIFFFFQKDEKKKIWWIFSDFIICYLHRKIQCPQKVPHLFLWWRKKILRSDGVLLTNHCRPSPLAHAAYQKNIWHQSHLFHPICIISHAPLSTEDCPNFCKNLKMITTSFTCEWSPFQLPTHSVLNKHAPFWLQTCLTVCFQICSCEASSLHWISNALVPCSHHSQYFKGNGIVICPRLQIIFTLEVIKYIYIYIYIYIFAHLNPFHI